MCLWALAICTRVERAVNPWGISPAEVVALKLSSFDQTKLSAEGLRTSHWMAPGDFFDLKLLEGQLFSSTNSGLRVGVVARFTGEKKKCVHTPSSRAPSNG